AAPSTVKPITLDTKVLGAEDVKVAGFGRTATEWVPDRPRVATFRHAGQTDTTHTLEGDQDTCLGDAGGPAFREHSDGYTGLVGISSTSWQHGCLGVTETRSGSTEIRTDDIVGWIRQQYAGQKLQNHNGLCVDIASNAPGTKIGMASCQPGRWTSQQWQLGGDGTIRNYNGLCLDIASNAPGTQIGTTECKPAPGWTSQQWKLPGDGTIRNHNGLCWDLGSNAPGSKVVLATCQPAPGWISQQWWTL
ncbi:MAG: hypothetical protein QOF58_3085, partial [Pseudonocardiales bacterium]|nr:hypothetical protein [Pseudonocardiales bacterium]